MARKRGAVPRLTTVSILNFLDELTALCQELDDPAITKQAETIAEARIKEICEQLYPADSTVFSLYNPERFRSLFMRRWLSSGDFADYSHEINKLMVAAAQQSAETHRNNLRKISNRRWSHNSRNMQMAREYLQKRKSVHYKDSQLKAEIGRRRGLKRSASIEAVNRGLKLLAVNESVKT